MSTLTDSIYLILEPKRTGVTNPLTGRRSASSFRITGTRRERPTTKAGQYFVKIDLNVDSGIFDQIIPVATIDIEEGHVMVNAEVEGVPQPAESIEEQISNDDEA